MGPDVAEVKRGSKIGTRIERGTEREIETGTEIEREIETGTEIEREIETGTEIEREIEIETGTETETRIGRDDHVVAARVSAQGVPGVDHVIETAKEVVADLTSAGDAVVVDQGRGARGAGHKKKSMCDEEGRLSRTLLVLYPTLSASCHFNCHLCPEL